MNLRLIDWIWRVRGELPLLSGQSAAEALDRLEPLLATDGTTRERTSDALAFTKRNAAAQDRMAIFDSGTLRVERSVLRYDLVSRALLFCFLAPFLFLAFAQATIALNTLEKPAIKAKHEKKDVVLPLNPIDKALGAPAPEKPKKDKDKPGGRDKKPSPTPSYVFAGLFATLYVIGRVLEAILVRRRLAALVTG